LARKLAYLRELSLSVLVGCKVFLTNHIAVFPTTRTLFWYIRITEFRQMTV